MQVGPGKYKTSFFAIFGSSKIHGTHKHSNTCHGLNFHCKLIFFEMLVTMSSIRINNNWNYQKNTNYHHRIPFSSPDLLYIVRGNGYFSQAVGDTSFPLWHGHKERKNTYIKRSSVRVVCKRQNTRLAKSFVFCETGCDSQLISTPCHQFKSNWLMKSSV